MDGYMYRMFWETGTLNVSRTGGVWIKSEVPECNTLGARDMDGAANLRSARKQLRAQRFWSRTISYRVRLQRSKLISWREEDETWMDARPASATMIADGLLARVGEPVR